MKLGLFLQHLADRERGDGLVGEGEGYRDAVYRILPDAELLLEFIPEGRRDIGLGRADHDPVLKSHRVGEEGKLRDIFVALRVGRGRW